uniref:NACHT domain-containing protein n=1 Tax=Candidatus Methanophagaceae archaeon ANME-1 ERB6 TaxID=2759912 RepID=A0A7G9YTN2_9EURY|nr:hypothetical protein KMJFBAND_00003 [Methanosarcinales archaeon ANME-1 ERB6]
MDGIPRIDAFMSEIWGMYSGRDLKKFIPTEEYDSKTLNFVKVKLHDLKAEREGRTIKWLSVGVGEGRDLEVLYAKGLRPINIDFYGIDVSDDHFEKIKNSTSKLDEYLFCWDNVPGNDSERIISFLRDELDIGWVENAKILKFEDGKTIRISDDENSAEIMIGKRKGKATLKISDGRVHGLKVKRENGKLNIYLYENQVRVNLKKISAEEMNFKSKFDLISAILILHEVDPVKLPLIIRNMLKVLKNEGTLVISDFQKPYELEKNVVVWDVDDIKDILEQISPKIGVSFEIMASREFPEEFGFYFCIIKKRGRISLRFFQEFEKNIRHFISLKIDKTRKEKGELENQVKQRVDKIIGEKEIGVDTVSEYRDQITKKLEPKYVMKLFKIMLLRNQLEYLNEVYKDLTEKGVLPPPPEEGIIKEYVESIKNNDFFRYITNPMVSKSIPLENSYVKLAISGIVHDPEHRVEIPETWGVKDYESYKLYEDRRYREKVKEEIDPKKAVEKWRKLVILGDPGSGKTTLLKYLTLEAAHGRLKGEVIPFFMALREYTDPKNKTSSLIEFACEQYRQRAPLGEEEFEDFVLSVKELNKNQKALFILDGFDEIPHTLKQRVLDEIGRELNRYVVSSRQVGYTGGILNDKTLEVVELSDKSIREFIKNWMYSQQIPDSEKRRQNLIDHIWRIPRLKMLARNPLLLSIQCFVYQNIVELRTRKELPTRRVDLYREAINGLIRTLEPRGITKDDIDRLNRRINVNSVFSSIAFYYFAEVENAPRHIFEKVELDGELESISTENRLHHKYVDLLSDVVFRSEILHPLTMHEYHFLHLTFQEYYVAHHLANQANGFQTIVEKKRDPHWQEIIPLYAGMKSEGFHELIDKIWNNGRDEDLFYNNLFLIGRCLAEVNLEKAKIKPQDLENIKNQIVELSLRGELDIWKNGSAEVLSNIAHQFEDIEDKLIESLRDEDPLVRIGAIAALGSIGDEKAVEPLIPLLEDEDDSVRWSATEAFGMIGTEKAVEPLLEMLKGQYDDAMEGAAEALGTIGSEKIVKSLISLLKDKDCDGRWWAAQVLGKIDTEKALELAIPLLKDKDDHVRENASGILGFIGNEKAVEPLISMLNDEEKTIRQSAAESLGWIRNEKAVEPLISMLNGEEDCVWHRAAEALGEIGSEKAVEPLISMLKDKDCKDRTWAAGALGEIGSEKAVEPLISMLNYEKKNSRYYAALALGMIGSEGAVEPLILMLNDEKESVRWRAAEALGKIGSDKAVEPLISMLNDEEKTVRRSVTEALGEIGNEKAVEPLISMLKDKDSSVRNGAAEALKKIRERNNLYIPLSKYKNLYAVCSGVL